MTNEYLTQLAELAERLRHNAKSVLWARSHAHNPTWQEVTEARFFETRDELIKRLQNTE
jgi:hypothetical protein